MACFTLLHPACMSLCIISTESFGIIAGVAANVTAIPDRYVADTGVGMTCKAFIFQIFLRMTLVREMHIRPAAGNLKREIVLRRIDYRGGNGNIVGLVAARKGSKCN